MLVIFFFLFVFVAVLDSEVGESIVVLSSWAIVGSEALRSVLERLLWDDTCWVDEQGEVLLKVG